MVTDSIDVEKFEKDMENLTDLVLATDNIDLMMNFERYMNELHKLFEMRLKFINQKNFVNKLGKDIRDHVNQGMNKHGH